MLRFCHYTLDRYTSRVFLIAQKFETKVIGGVNMLKGFKLKQLLTITLMAVISFIIMFLEMPLPIFPEFLKVDLSDLPALITGLALGPVAGILVELLKNVLHLLRTSTGGVGELANFLVGVALILPSSIIYKKNQNKKLLVMSMVGGILLMGLVGGLANYFILLPFYQNFMPMEAIIGLGSAVNPAIKDTFTLILYAIIPFNILKGIVVTIFTMALYKRVSPLIKSLN
jgi:riboflavin transporter FmnP